MVGVDEGRERGFGSVVPFTSRCLATRVLRRSDDLEVRALELVIQFLPTWQIKSAPSPGCPGHEKHFLPAKLRQPNGAARSIRNRNVGRETRLEEGAADHRHFSKAPDARAGIGDHALAGTPRKRGDVEEVATHHGRRDGDANISAASALWLQLEFVDPRQVQFADPQRLGDPIRIGADLVQVDGTSVVQHCDAAGWRSLAENRWNQRCRANGLQELSSLHA